MYEGEDIAGKFGQSDYEYEIGFALSPQFFFVILHVFEVKMHE